MTLILGLHLPTRLFLAADTRLTVKLPSGLLEIHDNFWKGHTFNGNKISCVVAGDATFASYILKKIEVQNIAQDGIYSFRAALERTLPAIVDEYLSQGHEFKLSVFIFGGYETSKMKHVNSVAFAEMQSKNMIGSFAVKRQAMNKKILEGLVKAIMQNGGSLQPQEFEIDAPESTIFSVEITLPYAPVIKDIPCYDMALFAQGKLNATHAPEDVIQKLEVEVDSSLNGEKMIYSSSLVLADLIDTMIDRYALEAVGGDVLTMLLTPHGAVVPTGKIIKFDKMSGVETRISEIVVSDGQFCRRNTKGEIVPFERIINYSKNGESEI